MELYKSQKLHFLTFYIELSSKFVGLGLNLALLKIISLVTPNFYFFFLKCQMIVHKTKIKNKIFNARFFDIYNLL